MIEIDHLTKRYDGTLAVDDISFEVARGEIVGFLGPNGAGKTTTLRILTGYLPPSSGRCRVAGFDIEQQPLQAKAKIGYLPESNALYDDMVVAEFLDFSGLLRSMTPEMLMDRKREVVGLCGLKQVYARKIGELSRGFKQRVGLAQAILHDPEILVLDEPTTGLDPNQVVEIRDLIKRLGEQKTVIISTHILSEVEATCDRVVIINKGLIIADRSKDSLHQMVEGQDLIEIQLDSGGEDALPVLRDVPGVDTAETLREDGGLVTYEVRTNKGADPRADLFHLVSGRKWTLYELHRKVASLEDVFRELTTEG